MKRASRNPSATIEQIAAAPVGALVTTMDGLLAWRRVGPSKSDWQIQKPVAGTPDGWGPRPDQPTRVRIWLDMTRMLATEGLRLSPMRNPKRTSRGSKSSPKKRVHFGDDVDMSVSGGNDFFRIAVTVPPSLGGGSGFITAGIVEDDAEERLFTVNEIHVAPRRRGIGTLLWTAAAREAERRGGLLASEVRISDQAETFWKKQFDKGRATSRSGGEGPRGDAPIYVLRFGVNDLSNNPGPALSENQLQVLRDVATGRARKPAGHGANAASAWNRGLRSLQAKGLVTWSSREVTDLGRAALEGASR